MKRDTKEGVRKKPQFKQDKKIKGNKIKEKKQKKGTQTQTKQVKRQRRRDSNMK